MMTFKKNLFLICLLVLSSGCATLNQSSKPALENEESVDVPKLIALGDDALRKGDVNTAQIKYALAAEREPKNISVLYKLGVIHGEQETYNIAEGLLRRAQNLSPDHQGVNEALGMLMMKQERLGEAKIILSAALENRPDSWRVLNALGIIEDMSAMHENAQEYFIAALFIAPRSAKLLNNIGYSYYLSGDYARAEGYFKQALQYDPNSSNAWSNLGLTYSRLGRYNDAKASFTKVVEAHQAANNLGYLALLQDKHDLAYTEFNSAISTSPSYYAKANQNMIALQNTPKPAITVSGLPNRNFQQNSTSGSFAGTPIITVGARKTPEPVLLPETKLRKETPITPTVNKTASMIKVKRGLKATGTLISQGYLNYLGFELGTPDGKLGDRTRSALKSFQHSFGLNANGKLDKVTYKHLKKAALTQLQRELIFLGYNPGLPDGKSGKGTLSALQQFSAAHNIKYTGKIDNAMLMGVRKSVRKQGIDLNSPNTVDLSSRG